MSGSIWSASFNRIGTGSNAGGLFATVGIDAPYDVSAGPASVRVNWGAPDLISGPQVQTFLPPATGNYEMPPGSGHAYADGSYVLRVIGDFAGTPTVVTLTAFIDLNNTVGTVVTGDGRANLMMGGAGDDSLSGLAGNDWLNGGEGNDTLLGGIGDDLLGGGAGNDSLNGGDGNDFVIGDEGNDTVLGGAGDDFADGGEGQDLVNGGAGNDFAKGGLGADTLYGGDGNDVLYGDVDGVETILGSGADLIYGGNGDDVMYGGDGNDTLFGGDGSDIGEGGFGDDQINGGEGDDDLNGRAGNDTLNGGNGADAFEGGEGADLLVSTADGQADTFYYAGTIDGGDRILGFEAGIDRIALTFVGAVDAAHFIAPGDAMTDNTTYLIYDAARGRFWIDLDGSDAGDRVLMATFVGAPALSLSDFDFVTLA